MQEFATLPVMIVAIVVALTVHEWAHAFIAKRLGDPTAEEMGRLTLNPIAHLDPLGAILFLVVGFGWAKPVPVDPRNFRHPVRDNALVAAAGPLSNLVLAFVVAALMVLFPIDLTSITAGSGLSSFEAMRSIASSFLVASLRVNVALMAFNLLPIPPLDGSNILRMFIPWNMRERYDEVLRYGPWILLAVILAESFLHIPILSAWVGGISRLVIQLFSLVL